LKCLKLLFQLSDDILKNNREIFNLILLLNTGFSPKIKVFPLVSEKNEKKFAGVAFFGAFENLDHIDGSLEQYKRAIQLDPESVESYSNLAWLYVRMKKYDKAVVIFKKALDLQPDNLNSLNNLGWLHVMMEKDEEALEYFMKALKLDPDNPLIHNNIGIIYLKQGDLIKAKSKLEFALKLDKSGANPGVSYFFPRNVVHIEKNPERALEYLEKSRELDLDNDEVYYRLGLVLRQIGNEENQIKC